MAENAKGILIVSGDWQSRALLRAQLIEEGFEVRACESLRDAVGLLNRSATRRAASGRFKTGLLVADLSNGWSADEVDQLSRIAREITVWVIASRGTTQAADLSRHGFESVLFRPVDMRSLVEGIKRRLVTPAPGPRSTADLK